MLPSYGSLPTTVPREHAMISRPSARALRTVLAAAALLAFASSRSHRIVLRAALRASDSGADSLNLRSFSSVEARRRPFRHVVRARVAARDEATLAVRYTPLSATKLPPLWSRSINITAGTAVDVDFALARLRPNTRYRATLFAARRGAAETAWPLGVLTFASAPTGCAAFDNGSLAEDARGSASWDVVLTPWRQPGCADDRLFGDTWEGLLGLDAEGWAVFAHAVDTPGPAQQLSSGDIVMLAGGDFLEFQESILRLAPNGSVVAESGVVGGGLWTGPHGCTCASQCEYFSHEIREVSIDGAKYVLTERTNYGDSPFGAEGMVVDGSLMFPDLFEYQDLWLWDAEGAGDEHWTQLTDLQVDLPIIPRRRFEVPVWYSNSWLNVTCTAADDDDDDGAAAAALANASARQLHLIDDMFGLAGGSRGNSTFLVNDVLHTSSADVRGGALVMTLRQVNAIVALDVATKELLWLVASPGAMHVDGKSLAISDADEMFSPHMVSWLDDDVIAFVDDGTNRRGCTQLGEFWTLLEGEVFNTSACWSRAVVMRVDATAGTATIERQFEWPLIDEGYAPGSEAMSDMAVRDVANSIGGTFWKIPGSEHRFLIGFTDTVNGPGLLWEVDLEDEAIEVVAAMKIASDHEFFYDPGTYRCTPVLSLDGESHTAPV